MSEITPRPLVSVIIIFFEAEAFLREAVQSVIGQTYEHWELLLVDDGSTDDGTSVARQYAAQCSERIRYFEHPGHSNRGMSASRNVGLQNASGEYVAFLDADDVWVPEKLERQLAIFRDHPEAGMVYGPGWYWHSWTGKPADQSRDFIQNLRVAPDTLVRPPELVQIYLRDPAATPGICGVLIAREVLKAVGGFEDDFKGMYEDQVLYVKVALAASIFISGQCWYRYRQHDQGCCAVAFRKGTQLDARLKFLRWVSQYLTTHSIKAREVERVLKRELRRVQPASGMRAAAKGVARVLGSERARRWLSAKREIWCRGK